MTLSPGTTLGSFEISDLLGVGGMGEVYRAKDTKARARGSDQGSARVVREGRKPIRAIRARGPSSRFAQSLQYRRHL